MDGADPRFAPDAPQGERLYAPAADERQFSARAVLAGCLLGGVVSAMNIYFGLRTGWSIGGSLIAAILGYSLFSVLRPSTAYTRLEANITQTAGSAAGSMTSAAGLLAAIPALGMLGVELSWLQLTVWALSVAYLGVFFAVPLRRQMVVVEKLRFPTGTATAETIMAMFSSGGDAKAKARALLLWGLGAGLFTLAAFFIPQLGHPPLEFGVLAIASAWGFSILISPLMAGAGILIGMRVAASLFAGAVVSWAILGPYAQSQGWAAGEIMNYSDGVRGWLLWPGVAIMVADALTRLALSWRTILNTFTASAPSSGEDIVEDPDQMIPNSWWIGGLVVATAATTAVAAVVFSIPWYLTLLAVAMSSVLAMIAVRSTGETDINPIGGMGKITQLVYGGVAPGAMTTNLMAAAITGAGASQAGDMMQDLKTGYLLGANPRKQFQAQLLGIFAGVLFCVPIYKLFDSAYEIGGEELPAPAAHAWRAMAELLSEGLSALPPQASAAVIGGLIFGAIMAVLGQHGPKAIRPYLPSGLAFGIAFIVPAYYSVAMFIGAVVFALWKRRSPSAAEALGFSIASGLIAGEGLMGIVVAILTLLGVQPLT
ncbi:MAG: OPT family oligopeptide transporter [Myxococcota bacterium]